MINGPFIVFYEKTKKVKGGFESLRDAQKFAYDNEKNEKEKLIAMSVNEYKLDYINENYKKMNKKITIEELKQIIREVITEEVGLTRRFDDVVSQYKALMIEKQNLVKDFVKKIRTIKDLKVIEKMKREYIKKLKTLNSRINSFETKFEKSVKSLPDPNEDELL